MLPKISVLVVVTLLFFACSKKSQINGYTRHANGFYYKLLGIGDGNETAKYPNVIIADAEMRTQSDSVFWDTKHDAPYALYIDLSKKILAGSCNTHFLLMVGGDSASFLVKPSVFFKDYFDKTVPAFCKNDSLIKMNVKIREIISPANYSKILHKTSLNEDKELLELKYIDEYLKQNYPNTKPDHYGLYTLTRTHTTQQKVVYGQKIKVNFTGCFLDGKPIDNGSQTLEFVYGTPDQLVKGLNIVIGNLKKGETTKIIVPSRLAFGELGSSNGAIPPYTPLVYNLKLIDIK